MLSFNLEGFKRNKHYLSHLLSNVKPKIVFLQEIWLPYSEENILSNHHPEYSFKISTPDMFKHPEDLLGQHSHVWHGVAIGWRNDISGNINILDSTCERIVGVKIQLSSRYLLLLSFYAPTSGRDEDFLESISSLSEYLQRYSSPGDQVLIGADSNCSTKSSPRRQQAWKNFCESFQLQNYNSPLPSFHHHNGTSESFLDLFAASTSLALGDIIQYCTLETPMNLSSHDPIETTISVQLESPRNESKFEKTYTDFKRNKIIWESSKLTDYQQLAEKALSDALSYWDTPETIPLLSCLVSNLLVSCASIVFETRSPTSRSHPRKHSRKILQAQSLLNRSFSAWKQAGKPPSNSVPSRRNYTDARSNLQRLQRQEENYLHIREHNNLMNLDITNRSQIFAALKKSRGISNNKVTPVLHTPVGTYHGDDVLEGFAADAEHLGKSNEDDQYFDQGFYRLCKLENLYIFDISSEQEFKIPSMEISQLNHILNSKMKPGKACDVYQLTVEHLRNSGDNAKLLILNLINRILKNIYYLSCPQIKLGLGTAIHKGKKKPITMSKSYRRITVTPILGAIIDYYLDPIAEALFRPSQSPDQLGFTSGISYLLAAIQRGECQRWAVDQKLTCFGVSLDGEAAFPSVEREIQVRELYTIGERGDLLHYSKNTYKNTECHLKMKDKLSRKVVEYKGNRQGHVRSSGHFKVYINPCLLSLNSSNLGFNLGPLCTTAVCVADDAYLLSDSPSGLQGALDIISHYAKQYQLRFNADKTKVVVTGSKLDMAFYKDTTPWTLNGEKVKVVDCNEHLGLVVSGTDEEQRNVDENIIRCRNSLFALLGPAFSYKCLLSPLVQIHIWRTCCLPVLVSGLPALPIRPTNMKPLEIFHNKTMRGFLKLSQSSSIPALHFLLGELPVEGVLHIRTLSLFHNIWSNPDTTVHAMVMYILKMCSSKSTTLSNHIQLLCLQYGIPSPLSLLQSPPWPKQDWNTYVKTKVTIWHERKLRSLSLRNSKMAYLNIQLHGLSGRPHSVLQSIRTTQDAKKLRLHLKFLTCDILTNERRSLDQPGVSPACDLCDDPIDSIEHALVSCKSTADIRGRLFPELMNTVAKVQPMSKILQYHPPAPILTQFVLDCTSFNLPDDIRIPVHNPGVTTVHSVCRDWCYAVGSERSRLLKALRRD